jgi:hypothetical protein
MKTFTINEIKNYLQQQNDLEHIKHNVTEKDIIKANKTVMFTLYEIKTRVFTMEDVLFHSSKWVSFCNRYKINYNNVNDSTKIKIHLFVKDAKEFKLI